MNYKTASLLILMYLNWHTTRKAPKKHLRLLTSEDVRRGEYWQWFHLSSYLNRQNSRIWSSTNPREIKSTPLHDQKFGVWCPVSRNRIIGPHTSILRRYDQFGTLLLSDYSSVQWALEWGCFQQGATTAHTQLVFP
jgi:hypothetical protein